MGGPLVKLIYASKATAPLGREDLADLLVVARSRNEDLGLTGMLLFAHDSFLQQLEGDEELVETVFASIKADPRHTEIRLLAHRPTSERSFQNWWMGFEHPDDQSLAHALPGFKAATAYPLVNADLVMNETVAETLLRLYARNP